MAYRYNEKTGEFEDVPKTASSTKNSSSDEGGGRKRFFYAYNDPSDNSPDFKCDTRWPFFTLFITKKNDNGLLQIYRQNT